ncbi:MAG: NADP-dependent oxidoreductase [Gemmobacter sp.]|uniref:NADP-dependent oxidoreductase n=1 Tax=Gemmobacter sp. TaxID=1898957 RepID=UPI0039197728
MTETRQIVLAARPEGEPGPEHFRLETATLPALAEGQFRVRLIWMSLDPYMRGRMSAAKSYVPPIAVGAPMQAGAVAEVAESRHPGFVAGDVVFGYFPWAEQAVTDGAGVTKVDPKAAPLSAWLGVLGMPGFTGWIGLNRVARGKAGETIVVSAATGAVGSMVCQLAKARGMRVIGVAGGAAKCARAVLDYGADACLDHRGAPDARALSKAIAEQAPDGVDVYFENVGGKTLEAVLPRMNDHGRIALCGAIAWYSGAESPPPLPPVWQTILVKRLTVQGFIVTDHQAHYPEFLAEVLPMVGAGRIRWAETVAEGLGSAPAAFLSLLRGGNDGKQLVRIGADPEAAA